MNNQIFAILKRKLEDVPAYGGINAEVQRNALKEELQFYVLNFIYHHAKYRDWIMYGGSALRICHDLNRMSVDLDFEINHSITKDFLDKLKKAITAYFKENYGIGTDFLTIGITNNRGLILKFHIGEAIGLAFHSKQVHVKIDLNFFIPSKMAIERRPINRDQLSFVIKTYNMPVLMASKIAAVFLRGQRGVNKAVYEEKGRDIYDLLWYMTKKVIPNLDYLIAKGIDVKNLRVLFDKLTLQMNKVNDTNLKQDLTPLFTDPIFIENWLKNWRITYQRLFEDYDIRTVTELEKISIFQEFHTDNYFFVFWYNTDGGKLARVMYSISDYWIRYREGVLQIPINEKVKNTVEFSSNGIKIRPASQDKLMQYATLFYQKTENYLKKMNHTIFGDTINTKLVIMTAENLNLKERIVLNRSSLLSSELEDLLK